MALSAKQQRFVEEYLIDFNATQAAGRAGYSDPNYGRQLITHPNVAPEIAARMKALSEKADVTTEEIVAGLKKEATREDDDASHAARVSAWAHLGKYRGMFTDRHEVDARLEVVIRSE